MGILNEKGEVIVADGLRNAVSGMGTSRDKATSSAYYLNQLTDQQLINSYRGSWICKKMVTIPAEDSTRKWREWSGDDVETIREEEKRHSLRQKVKQAKINARLFGGAALLIGADDMDMAEPINLERIGKGDLNYVTLLDRFELTPGDLERDPRAGTNYRKPQYYEISGNSTETFRVHPTRLALFYGPEVPRGSYQSGQQFSWGDSVLQSAYEAALHADSTVANLASLVFEAKVDIVKIPGLTKLAKDPRFEEAVISRLEIFDIGKSNHHLGVIDSEEDMVSRTYNFAGLPDVLDRFFQVVSGASDIPMTRFFGTSAKGLNATGDGDMNNYHEMVSSIQENEMTPALSVLDEVLIRSAYGTRPEELKSEWRPLKEMSEAEEADILSKTAAAVKTLAESGLINEEALSEAATRALDKGALAGIQGDIEALPEVEEIEEVEEI